jgi:bacterioferritin-associated ferredoxin
MIVCVCKAVSDRLIRSAIGAGVDTFEDLQLELGVAVCCGKCADTVRDVLSSTPSVPNSACTAAANEACDEVPITFYQREAA